MIPIPPIVLKLGTIGLILSATYIGGCVRGSQMANDRIERISADYANFRINTEIVGKAAQAAADERKALDERRKVASDESYAKALGVLGRDIGELRKRANSGANDLRTPAPTPLCAEGLRCFDREQFDSALGTFQSEIEELVVEGAKVKLRLDYAIKWASELGKE